MLKLLSLMLWGATIMVFIDHLASYLAEGGEFLEMSPNALVLGFVMLLGALILWELVPIIKDPKGILYKRKTKYGFLTLCTYYSTANSNGLVISTPLTVLNLPIRCFIFSASPLTAIANIHFSLLKCT